MKAKEYADRYKEQCVVDRDAALGVLVRGILMEIQAIGRERHAVKDSAFVSIVKEQELKWKAICRLCPDLKEGGFRAAMFDKMPQIAEAVWGANGWLTKPKGARCQSIKQQTAPSSPTGAGRMRLR